jgi:hypothetical protein
LGSMAPCDHEFAPAEGELAGLGEVLPVEAGPKHFLSGAVGLHGAGACVDWLHCAVGLLCALSHWLHPGACADSHMEVQVHLCNWAQAHL